MIALALFAALSATPATFASVIAKAGASDTITLAPGFYPPTLLKYRPVHLLGPPTAVFPSLTLYGSLLSGSSLDGFSCVLTPTAATTTATPCLKLTGVAGDPLRNVTVSNLTIRCGNAVSGWDPSVPPPPGWPGGNVIGQPTGQGVAGTYFDTLAYRGGEVSNCHRGIGISFGTTLTVQGVNIHNVRTTPITSTSVNGALITGNWLHDVTPWNPNHDGNGDHSDFGHFLNMAGKPASANFTITSNLLEQGAGAATLGIHMDDQKTGLGFAGTTIASNVILSADTQGVRLENVGGFVTGNTLLQPGPGKPPQIIICNQPIYCQPSHVTLSGNITAPGIATPLELQLAKRLLNRD